MEIKNIYGIDPNTIANNMRSALAIDQELLYRLESRGMLEEENMLLHHAKSCYKTLAEVTNYLEMERYRNGTLHECDFSISDYCKDMLGNVKSKMRRSNIRFSFELEKGIVCRCDPERLATCVINLIVNSYSWVDQDDGEIHVTLKRHSDHAAITVIDNGSGMTTGEVEALRDSGGTRGFNVMYSFCNSVGFAPLIETSSEKGGLMLSVRIPLSPADPKLKLESPVEVFRTGLLSPSEVLLYKLADTIVKL